MSMGINDSVLSEAFGLVTAAVIARNEAEVIAETLASVAGVADELLVIDTGSNDGTAEIAASAGARVVHQPWTEDFSAARNRGLREAHGQWILWLDAGERLAAGADERLREFVARSARCDTVYSLLVELPSSDGECSGEQIAVPRLMPKRSELYYVGRVRETVLPAATAAGLATGLAPATILRSTRDHRPERRAERARRNLALAEREMREVGVRAPRPLLAAAEALAELGRIEEALKLFDEAASGAEPGSSERLESHYGRLSALGLSGSAGDALLDACMAALEEFPLDAQLLLTLGNVMQQRNRLALAARCFDMAVKFGRVDLSLWHLAELPEVAVVCLATVLQLQNLHEQAERILREASTRSTSQRLIRPLVDLYIAGNRPAEAIAAADRLPIAAQWRSALREAIYGACAAAAGEWTVALARLQIAYLEGLRHPLCLRWLAITYLANGEIEAALPILREWQAEQPHNAEVKSYLDSLCDKPAAGRATVPAVEKPADAEAVVLRVDPPQSLPAVVPGIPIETPSPLVP